jgi:hypothetical protein
MKPKSKRPPWWFATAILAGLLAATSIVAHIMAALIH